MCGLKPTCFEGELEGLDDGSDVGEFEGLVDGDVLGEFEGWS